MVLRSQTKPVCFLKQKDSNKNGTIKISSAVIFHMAAVQGLNCSPCPIVFSTLR